eukprot:1328746-Rhodomonas_salina.1
MSFWYYKLRYLPMPCYAISDADLGGCFTTVCHVRRISLRACYALSSTDLAWLVLTSSLIVRHMLPGTDLCSALIKLCKLTKFGYQSRNQSSKLISWPDIRKALREHRMGIMVGEDIKVQHTCILQEHVLAAYDSTLHKFSSQHHVAVACSGSKQKEDTALDGTHRTAPPHDTTMHNHNSKPQCKTTMQNHNSKTTIPPTDTRLVPIIHPTL